MENRIERKRRQRAKGKNPLSGFRSVLTASGMDLSRPSHQGKKQCYNHYITALLYISTPTFRVLGSLLRVEEEDLGGDDEFLSSFLLLFSFLFQ
jgi:hypothetical protein